MADTKITALAAITTVDPAADVLPIVDISDTSMAASGTTKKITSNQILGAGGTATLASATITGDLTVRTTGLTVNSSGVGIGTSSQSSFLGNSPKKLVIGDGTQTPALTLYGGSGTYAGIYFADGIVGNEAYRGFIEYDHATDSFNFGRAGSTAMTLNSTGLGVGVVPGSAIGNLQVGGSANGNLYTQQGTDTVRMGMRATGRTGILFDSSDATYTNRAWYLDNVGSTGSLIIGRQGLDVVTFSNTGNVGVGVTPSAWLTGIKSIDIQSGGLSAYSGGITHNAYYDNTDSRWEYKANGAATFYNPQNGIHQWFVAASGTANNPITTFATAAMTLDASGNLLVGSTATATAGVVLKPTGTVADGKSFEVFNTSSASNSSFYCPGSGAVNGVATGAGAGGLVVVNKDSGNLRSISAAGTINASGADYAEYMTKASDFVLTKGDVAGIDATGKLTNVFADAVSFVVKSTDPSYVGNDKWGVGLEGSDIEAARQLVDRIAFAGQVPVNVTGAKAGDYIVPVVNGTGIKGQAVSNPTFEQYQLAVGKVIAIDADGRARIIVKVA